jgi:hypothetical protein
MLVCRGKMENNVWSDERVAAILNDDLMMISTLRGWQTRLA